MDRRLDALERSAQEHRTMLHTHINALQKHIDRLGQSNLLLLQKLDKASAELITAQEAWRAEHEEKERLEGEMKDMAKAFHRYVIKHGPKKERRQLAWLMARPRDKYMVREE